MQLQCYKDSRDYSLLNVLDPAKIVELQLDFQDTNLEFWKNFYRYSSLRKLSINLTGEIDSKVVLVDDEPQRTSYTGEIIWNYIKQIDCLTEISLKDDYNYDLYDQYGDRNTNLLDNFFNMIQQPKLERFKFLTVSGRISPAVFNDILTKAVNLQSLTLTEGSASTM